MAVNSMIDNFETLIEYIDFVEPTDRYIVHIMRRPRDCRQLQNQLGSNESQRLIRTYYIDSKEYFRNKIPAMKELCKSCNARAYLIVSPKDNFECLLNLGAKVLKTIQNKNYSVKPEHLLREAYCENHKTRRKLWILDLDNDCMEVPVLDEKGKYVIETKTWTAEDVVKLVKAELKDIEERICKKTPRKYMTWLEDQVIVVPTRNGCHVITPPFNLKSALSKCQMMYENEKTFTEKHVCGPGEHEEVKYKKVGWLHKDGMTLLYYDN